MISTPANLFFFTTVALFDKMIFLIRESLFSIMDIFFIPHSLKKFYTAFVTVLCYFIKGFLESSM